MRPRPIRDAARNVDRNVDRAMQEVGAGGREVAELVRDLRGDRIELTLEIMGRPIPVKVRIKPAAQSGQEPKRG